MAYAYDQINSLIGQGTDQQNIFAPAAPQNAGGNQNNIMQDDSVKTTTGGESVDQGNSTNASGVSSGSGVTPKTSKSQAMPDSSAIVTQNSDAGTGNVLSTVQGGISKASSKLQNDADQYMSNAANRGVQDTIGRDQVGAAVEKGDSGAFNRIQNLLNGANPQVESFSSDVEPSDTGNNLKALATKGGLSAYLQGQNNSGNYTRGMANLDAAVTRNTQGYKDESEKARLAQESLVNQKADLGANEQGRAQAVFDQGYNEKKATARAALDSFRNQYQTQINNDTAAANQERAALSAGPTVGTSGVTEAMLSKINDPGIRDMFERQDYNGLKRELDPTNSVSNSAFSIGIDNILKNGLGSYINDPGAATPAQMVTPGNATAYNRIAQLLGEQQIQPGTGAVGPSLDRGRLAQDALAAARGTDTGWSNATAQAKAKAEKEAADELQRQKDAANAANRPGLPATPVANTWQQIQNLLPNPGNIGRVKPPNSQNPFSPGSLYS